MCGDSMSQLERICADDKYLLTSFVSSYRTLWAHFSQAILKFETLLTHYKLMALAIVDYDTAPYQDTQLVH